MRISVIIPTYNRALIVKEAIESVLVQTFQDFELIIVDNYSGDDTESVVGSYHDQRIRYFKNQNNGLVSVNRNFGIQKAGGEYIAFLDDDDLWLPEKLEKQVKLMDSNKELGLVYSDCYIMDDAGSSQGKTYFSYIKPIRGAALKGLLQENTIATLTAMVSKKALDKVGDFRTKYIIAQDYDLWLRIAQQYPIDFINEPLAKYRIHRGGASSKNNIINYKEGLQIRGYWLKKNPELKKELGGRTKILKYWPIFLGALGNIFRRKSFKSIKESFGLVKYMLFREYERD
ncbi:MAG: glycosyltransferase [Dehalococcoidales bacterium]|nr:glycosyltransferase [Dehalococcoidales bacterium]